jgi:NADPH:quinone reductase-like Zn-dependent oxidoreductase
MHDELPFRRGRNPSNSRTKRTLEWAFFDDLGLWEPRPGGKPSKRRKARCIAETAAGVAHPTIVQSKIATMRSHLMKCRFVTEAVREQLRTTDNPRSSKKAKREHPSYAEPSISAAQPSPVGHADLHPQVNIYGNNNIPFHNAPSHALHSPVAVPAAVVHDAAAAPFAAGAVTSSDAAASTAPEAASSIGEVGRHVPTGTEPPVIAHAPPGVVIRFMSPGKVVPQPLPLAVELGPGQVLVRAQVSAVSAGTEMLVYRGQMPADIPTDAVLGGETGIQAAKPFSYPASYGYATVGTIVACGSAVPLPLSVDTAVFAFREHSSWFVANIVDLQIVPDAVALSDATFLPSVETALSLAMDAAPLPGENVAVVGQGIIGLLLVALLKLCYGKTRVIAIDTLADRLLVSLSSARPDSVVLSKTGSDNTPPEFDSLLRAALPSDDIAGVDVAIDVSGHESGLDTAIRATRDGGRVVLGSWFGAKDVTLRSLGGRFHRSHINIIASQVSSIPASLQSRWNKSRRFRLAWDVLPALSPSTRFPVSRIAIDQAARAYSEIDRGMHVQVLFDYNVVPASEQQNGHAKTATPSDQALQTARNVEQLQQASPPGLAVPAEQLATAHPEKSAQAGAPEQAVAPEQAMAPASPVQQSLASAQLIPASSQPPSAQKPSEQSPHVQQPSDERSPVPRQ